MLQDHRQGVHSTSRIVGSYPTRPKSGRSAIRYLITSSARASKFGHFKVERRQAGAATAAARRRLGDRSPNTRSTSSSAASPGSSRVVKISQTVSGGGAPGQAHGPSRPAIEAAGHQRHLGRDEPASEHWHGLLLGNAETRPAWEDRSTREDRSWRNDAVEAGVMLRPFRNSRERMRIDANHPPPTHDPVNARHLSMQVTARIVETAAAPTGEGVEIKMLTTPAACRAFKPRPRLLVPRHENGVPVD